MSKKPESDLDAERTRNAQYGYKPEQYSSLVSVDVFGISDRGSVRKINEDHYLVVRVGRALETVLSNLSENQPGDLFEETGYGMVVADGLGGEATGEIASRQAIYTLLSLVLHAPNWTFRWGPKEKDTVKSRMEDRFRHVNAALVREATAHASLSGMCSTMTAAVSHGNSLIIGHIGDSRAYLLRQSTLSKLTRDHTLAQRFIDEGLYQPDDTLVVQLKNVLLQALGSQESECNPDVHDYVLEDGDQVMLCTDGLTDMVDDTTIESILNTAPNAKTACKDLLDLALANGGKDNVTIIVARYSLPRPR